MKKQKKLSPREKEEVLAILTIGCSRVAAARSIMRTPAFLRSAIVKDAEFAALVAKAESGTEIFCLSKLRQVANEGRYWKANTWLLEKSMPVRYAVRKPETLTSEQMQTFVEKCMQIIIEKVPNKKIQEDIFKRLAEELKE